MGSSSDLPHRNRTAPFPIPFPPFRVDSDNADDDAGVGRVVVDDDSSVDSAGSDSDLPPGMDGSNPEETPADSNMIIPTCARIMPTRNTSRDDDNDSMLVSCRLVLKVRTVLYCTSTVLDDEHLLGNIHFLFF